MIRQASIDDFNTIEKLARAFFDESGYKERLDMEIDEKSMIDFIVMMISDDDKVVLFDGDKGMITGVLVPFFFNNSKIIAQEMCWYVAKEFRDTMTCARLIKAFEQWAESKDADVLMMASISHLNGDRINKFYEKNNMNSMEQFYGKVLQCR